MSSRNDAQLLVTGSSRRGWHRLQLAAECLQKYAWTYKSPQAEEQKKVKEDGVFGTTAPALIKGSLMHLALAHHYRRIQAKQEGTDPEAWVEPVEAVELIARLNGPAAIMHVPAITRVYEAYQERYAGEEQMKRILGVEHLMEVTIREKYLLTGRLDLLYADQEDRVWVTDHKTSSKLNSSQEEFYAISGQLMGYTYMARRLHGNKVAGMKLNLVQVSGEPVFRNLTLDRSPNLEARFEQSIVDIEEAIERMEKSGRAYDDWPKAMSEHTCFGRYGACPFIDQCRYGAGTKPAGDWSWDDKP